MHRPDLPLRVGFVLLLALVTFLIGYPAAYLATHGFDPRAWPSIPGTPFDWFAAAGPGWAGWLGLFQHMASTYWNMLHGRTNSLSGGGVPAFLAIWGAGIVLMVPLIMGGRLVPLRHRLKRYGDARFGGPAVLEDGSLCWHDAGLDSCLYFTPQATLWILVPDRDSLDKARAAIDF